MASRINERLVDGEWAVVGAWIGMVHITVGDLRARQRKLVREAQVRGVEPAPLPGLYREAERLLGGLPKSDPVYKAGKDEGNHREQRVQRVGRGDTRGAVPVGQGLSRFSGKSKRERKLERMKRNSSHDEA